MKLEGVHHVSCITGDAPGNVLFYADKLGLRMVKKTVNQDDPNVYHLFYADDHGSSGADITFFEYPGAPRGRAGNGMVHLVSSASAPRSRSSSGETRVGGVVSDGSLVFEDPEGLTLELVVDDSGDPPLPRMRPTSPRSTAFGALPAFAPTRRARRSERAVGRHVGVRARLGGARRLARRLLLYDPPPGSAGLPPPAPCITSRGPRSPRSTRRGAPASSRAAPSRHR